MNLQSRIVYPNNCKPGDLLWACAYSQNHKTKQIHKVVPMMGILTLTNNFIDESETTNYPPQGENFIRSAYDSYQPNYQSYHPRYFVPIFSGRLYWEHAIVLSKVLLTKTKDECEAVYQERYETTVLEEEKNPYLLLAKLHMEHPKAKHLRIGQFLWLFQKWHQTTYEKDIFYVENKDLLKRVEEYLKTLQ